MVTHIKSGLTTGKLPVTLQAGTASGTLALNIQGLEDGEFVIRVDPDDGRILMGPGGKSLIYGSKTFVTGMKEYNIILNTGRVLQIKITV